MQKEDFLGIFRSMEGLPVTIRLLDPPLHEFLPDKEELDEKLRELEVSGDCGKIDEVKKIIQRVVSLKELNPMLGHRGCRLGITYPEIYNMQVRAIMEAACELTAEGLEVVPEIMIPLVGLVKELSLSKEEVVITSYSIHYTKLYELQLLHISNSVYPFLLFIFL